MKRTILSLGLAVLSINSWAVGLTGPSISANPNLGIPSGGGPSGIVTTNDFSQFAPGLIVEITGVTNYSQVNGVYTNAFVNVNTNTGAQIFRSINGFTNYVTFDSSAPSPIVSGTVLNQEFLLIPGATFAGKEPLLDLNTGNFNGYMEVKFWTNSILPRAPYGEGTAPDGTTISSFPSNRTDIYPVQTWTVGEWPIAAVINEGGGIGRFRTYGRVPINNTTNGALNCMRYESMMLDSNNASIGDRGHILTGKSQLQADGAWIFWLLFEIQLAADAQPGDGSGYANCLSLSGYSTVLVGALGSASDGAASAAKAYARLQVRGQGTSRPALLLEQGTLCTTITNGGSEFDGTNFMSTTRNARVPSLLGQAGHTNGVIGAASLTIVFNFAMPDTNYVPALLGNVALVSPLITAQTTTSFTIGMTAFTGNLRWSVVEETQKN